MSLSYPYTFTVNNVDLKTKVQRYSYETTYEPVYSDTITTMDRIDHTVIARWRHGISVTINPMSESDLTTLQNALVAANVAVVKFSSLQLGVDVTCNMRLDPSSAALVLKNASRRVIGEIPLRFTEL